MVLEAQTLLRSLHIDSRLNPCLGGIWSWRPQVEGVNSTNQVVLILVWVEYGLGEWGFVGVSKIAGVLILVWVEYGLGALEECLKTSDFVS